MMDSWPWYGLAVPVKGAHPEFEFRGEPQKCLASARDLRDKLPPGERQGARIVPGDSRADFPPGRVPGWVIERNAIEFASPLWAANE